ncbi:citrate lyase subunit alpha [Carboxylicivirga linearis]|uniref:Citrate lyase alpha chain n=1 Tax=Carboxylicivirga linearis TaxID=1628157 RepID=A0ABS5JYW8_9BACT|nr:citrate lyase subunit alpha [Carboxylicivirga linearis]MBS2100098.1 citrate lyase subunit alpha [Carboxylicivirga linearis]
MKNILQREIPETLEGIGEIEPFQGAFTKLRKGWMEEETVPPPNKAKMPHSSKMCSNLKEAVIRTNPRNGMTVSFHHHLRGGDSILVETIKILAELGIKDITLASSSLTSAHEPILPYLKNGTITQIYSSGIRGEIGEAVAKGVMPKPFVIHSHGGRVRSVHTGKIKIDLTVIAASAADIEGNSTGAHGPSAFGSMGYAVIDARYARQVVVVTDNIVDYPCVPQAVTQNFVDYVVKVDSIGDPSKIAGGTTRITKAPMDLQIARLAAQVIEHSGELKEGFSFQVGAGGASLAVAKYIRKIMKQKVIKGSFILGGVTSYGVDMLNEGLFKSIFDVQSFDAAVSTSLMTNPYHIEITAGLYANPFNCGCMTNKLDIVVLGALEIDTDFNVNVITGSEGYVRGASGGHSDTASGANLTVVVCPSFRGRIPIVKEKVHTIVTPGESIDVLVTERGICVNPNRPELKENLIKGGIAVKEIKDLAAEVEKITGVAKPIQNEERIVGIVEYRDGTVIDVIRQVK